MAIYGYLACLETNESLWLGKVLRHKGPDGSLSAFGFWMGPDPGHNYQKELLNKALWKFLAEHLGKELIVVTDDPAAPFDVTKLTKVTERLTLEGYVGDWPSAAEAEV